MRKCRHHYEWYDGKLKCARCGHRKWLTRGTKRKIGKASILVVLVIGGFFVYENYGSITKSIPILQQTIDQNPPTNNIFTLELPKKENVTIPISPTTITTTIQKTVNNLQNSIKDIAKPQQTSQDDSKQAINYINTLRVSNGEKPISFDQRVFDVALARAKDNYDYGYFDHTNPKTGTCSYTIKSQFGLVSNEDVAENLYMEGYGNTPILTNPQLNSAVDSWMSDFGHKHNLLYPDHVSGAVACYGGICAFEGLNYQGFGHGCYTASQGEAQFGKLDSCSEDQVKQYLALEQQLDAMNPKLQGMPNVATSQEQYNYYNGLVSQYNSLVNQINNFKC